MHVDVQDVAVWAELDEHKARRHARAQQLVRPLRQLRQQALQLARRAAAWQAQALQGQLGLGVTGEQHRLQHLPVVLDKARAQRLMARHQAGQCGLHA